MRGVSGPHGGHPSQKISAELAASLMPALGTVYGTDQWSNDEFWQKHKTVSGEPAFCRRELLDSSVIKTWFSNQVGPFKKAWHNASARAVQTVDELCGVDVNEFDLEEAGE